jgi:LytS/YehU family sensor histidine kinase
VSYNHESFINIDLKVNDNRLLLEVKNTKADVVQKEVFSGLGIENTRKRLDLLYGDKYHLDIVDSNEIFTVNLSIPLWSDA